VAQQEESHLLHQGGIRQQVVREVGVVTGAGEDADRSAEARGIVAGALERLPTALEKVSVLGIHDRGVERREAEEARVEELHVRERRAGLHVLGMGAQRGRYARRFQLGVV
jgi:predicted MPP superfamily phosphohydrolase